MARVARRKTTICDIATAADASATTVSLVLDGSRARYRIAGNTARRVTEAAERLGCDVDCAARSLRLSRSGLAKMILPHDRDRFFADLAEAFEREARRRGLCPIVVSTQRDGAVEAQVTRRLLAQSVEFLFIAAFEDAAEDAACLPFDVAMPRLDVEAMTRHAFEALAPAAQDARGPTLVPAEARRRRARPAPRGRAAPGDVSRQAEP